MCDRVSDIERTGATLVLVGTGSVEQARRFAAGLPPSVRVLSDPGGAAFRAAGARRGFFTAIHPGTFRAAWRAWRRGHRQQGTAGDPLQQGAVWAVAPGGDVLYRHVSAWAGDHPDVQDILAALRDSRPASELGPAGQRA